MLRFSLGDESRGRRLARWMCSLRKYPIVRFGFDTISILELKGSGFVRTDIGKQIDKSLKAAIAKKRDATTSIEEKCKLMEARIKVLQELLW